MHVSEALERLQTLARGVFPARLAETGLAEALRGWAEQQGRRVWLTINGCPSRLGQDEELAALLYFCSVSALASRSGDASLTVAIDEAETTFDIHLDGATNAGLDAAALQAIADRSEAFGGEASACPVSECVVHVRVPLVTGRP